MRAFTLAEVLITIAIIGIVAALTISGTIANTQQMEYKTGIKKATAAINKAITLNITLDGETPYDNTDLFNYLQRHMNILKSTTKIPYSFKYKFAEGETKEYPSNYAFYTADGMRYEFSGEEDSDGPSLHESSQKICLAGITTDKDGKTTTTCNGCGSYGLEKNPNNTTKPPCLFMVDVNGDKHPTPANVLCNSDECKDKNIYKYPAPNAKKVTDIFGIMVTEIGALPFGIIAQRSMYEARN